MQGRKSFIKIIVSVSVIVMLWFSAAFFDYNLVFEQEQQPVFCVSRWLRDDVKVYNGIGYSYTFIYKGGKTERIWFKNLLGMDHHLVCCD